LLKRDDLDVFAINCDSELARDVCDDKQIIDLIEQRMKNHLMIDELDENLLKELRNKELIQIQNDLKLMENELNLKELIERTRDSTNGSTILHICAAKGYESELKLLLKLIEEKERNHSLIDEFRDNDGFTPLMASAFWQQFNCFQLLLDFGANFELKTKDMRIVSDLLPLNSNCEQFFQLLKEKKEKNDLLMNSIMTSTSSETQVNYSLFILINIIFN
jgi:ankyrin repeat protein